MKVKISIWRAGVDEDTYKNLDLSMPQRTAVIKGNKKVIGKLFRDTVKGYAKSPIYNMNYNDGFKCCTHESKDEIIKMKFLDIAPEGPVYE